MHDFLPLKLTKENSLLLKREKKKKRYLGHLGDNRSSPTDERRSKGVEWLENVIRDQLVKCQKGSLELSSLIS